MKLGIVVSGKHVLLIKAVYVISLAADADSGEEAVIWITCPFADVPRYYVSRKKSFCPFVKVDGARRAKYKRLMNMRVSADAVEGLEDKSFQEPVRKRQRRQLDEEYDSRELPAGRHLPRIRQRALRALQLRSEQVPSLCEKTKICLHHPQRVRQAARGPAVSGQRAENSSD